MPGPRVKLTQEQKDVIGADYANGLGMVEIGKRFGIGVAQVRKIVLGSGGTVRGRGRQKRATVSAPETTVQTVVDGDN